MGQFLIAQAAEPAVAAAAFRKGIEAFERIAGLQPSACWHGGRLEMAAFPQLLARDSGPPPAKPRRADLVLDPSSGRRVCPAGLPFYRGRAGAAAMRELAGDLDAALTGDRLAATLQDLEGIFALATAAPGSDELLLITDRLGSLHVYTAQLGAACVITTSALVAAAITGAAWDLDGCREFLATGTVFETRSLFRGVSKLAPARIYRFAGGGLRSMRRYWSVEAAMFDRAPERGSVAALAESLEQAMRALAGNFRAPLLDLTGGFDSRALLGAALRVRPRGFATAVNGRAGSPDVLAAGRIARAFDLDHRHTLPVQDGRDLEYAARSVALTDGETDAFEYGPILRLHESLAAEFDVSINGSNGEICKGYWWELLFPHTGRRRPLDARFVAARRFAPAAGADILDQGFDQPLVEHFAQIIRRANAGLEGYPNTAHMDNLYLTLRMQRWQGRIASATLRLWPCASPFMWRRPMEAALSAPPRMRLRNRMSRRLIAHCNRQLAALPMAQGYPASPIGLANLHRFWPLAAEWGGKLFQRAARAAGAAGVAAAAGPPPARTPAAAAAQQFLRAGMRTRDLYQKNVYSALPALPEALLRRIATLELTARAISADEVNV